MKQFPINYAYLIYVIEYSKHVQRQSIELGVGFPEHHNISYSGKLSREKTFANLGNECFFWPIGYRI